MNTASSSPAPVLELSGLRVAYPGRRGAVSTPAVDGVGLSVGRGESVAVVGESGSGKTTLARSVLGLLPSGTRREGSLRLAGQDLDALDATGRRRLVGRRIGYVPQDPGTSLDPLLRVLEQVVEPLRIHGIGDPDTHRERALAAMREAGLPDPESLARRWPHELSGGQRQRVLIAAAIVTDPDLILADEPTSALDVTVQKRILDRLQELVRERGTALLMITHDLAVAAERTDRVVLMSRGRAVEQGPSEQVLLHPSTPQGRALAEAMALTADAVDTDGLGVDGEGAGRTAVDGKAAPWADQNPADSPAARTDAGAEAPVGVDGARTPVLTGEGLSRTFGSRREPVHALREAAFSLAEGGSLAVVGESGSGKTTLARILLGLERTDAGRITLRGAEVTRRDRSFRRTVQPVFQNPHSSFDPSHTVGWSVLEPVRALGSAGRAQRRELLGRLFDDVGLDRRLAARRPRELSGGQLQRAAIARALSVSPDVLVCDEAVSALDASVQAQVLRLLQRLRDERGLSLLFITHDLAVVRWLCEDVLVMREGRIVEAGPVSRIFRAPQQEYTRELIAAIPRPLRAGAAA
ncbi:MAG: ABC transporter ATP-binding protein [Actinomycetia bacterium]|nr:ABC transporter ATP-binding protein [Actinomycetes bacterium]